MALFPKNNNSKDQSIIEHLEELRWHLIRMVLAVFVLSIIAFIFIDSIFKNFVLAPTHSDFISYRALCWLGKKLAVPSLCMDSIQVQFQNFKMAGQFMMSISTAFIFGIMVSFPYLVFELWLFIKPAFTQKELGMSKRAIFWVSLLFFLGAGFGYYIIAPLTINFFANYSISPEFQNIFQIDDYFDTLISLVMGTGIIFEIPVFIYFLSRLGLVTPRFLKTYRKYAVLIILILAAMITPSGDIATQLIVAIPILFLYEVSIIVSARVEKKKLAKERAFIEQY